MATYEDVVRVDPNPERKRPILLIGENPLYIDLCAVCITSPMHTCMLDVRPRRCNVYTCMLDVRPVPISEEGPA